MPESEKGTDAVAGTLDYDHTKLELEEVKTGDPKLQEPVFNGDNGKFTTLIKSETIRQSVHAVKFVFKIKSDATGETTVRVSKLEVADAEDAKQTGSVYKFGYCSVLSALCDQFTDRIAHRRELGFIFSHNIALIHRTVVMKIIG